MIFSENCQLEFNNPAMAKNNNDILFAYNENDGVEDDYSETEMNYYNVQQTGNLAYDGVQE